MRLPDIAAADAALADESVVAVVVVPADLSDPGTIRFDTEPDQFVTQLVTAAVVALRTQAVLTDAGVSESELLAAQQAPAVDALDPQTDADGARFLFANIGAVLVLVGIFSFGFTVLTGVVEEKQSRVVEVVLSTVRARDLLMGKVLGIGVLGLGQLAVFVVAALAAAALTDRFVLPDTTPERDPAPGRVVRAGLRALCHGARIPWRARIADGGGVERVDAGDDGGDGELLRGGLRGRQ